MNNSLAPIILFVYNRPWHTEQTLEALMKNELADQSLLYIFCDGAMDGANQEDAENIKMVKALIRKKEWCKEIIIKERDENLGLANSVILGVSEVLDKHSRVIVLEDDIVTGKYFLKFINEGLRIYEKEELVYGISGYCFPSFKKIKEATYFLPVMSSWGYGTWKDRWEKINFNGDELFQKAYHKGILEKLNFSNINYHQMLREQVEGKNDSWAVRFYVSMFLEGGLFLYPKFSLLENIGLDGSGVHCKAVPSQIDLVGSDINDEIPVKKQKLFINKNIINSFKSKTALQKKDNYKKIKRLLKKIITPEIIQLVKSKTAFSEKLNDELINIPRYTETTVNLYGKKLIIPDVASFRFMHKEIFELEIYKFKTSTPEPYIIDGGANIGLASIYFNKLYPSSKIISFEPDPEIFKMLKQNIGVFDFRRIELIQKGLWNANTTLFFKSEGADSGLIAEIDKNNSAPESKIEVVSLKPYLQQPVDFLKLDIEGAETVVLKDIQGDLGKIERIFVEYHSFIGQTQTLNEIIEILTKAKFRLHISSPGLESISPFIKLNVYNNMDMQLNIYGYKEN